MSDYQLELALAAQRSVTGPGTERAAASSAMTSLLTALNTAALIAALIHKITDLQNRIETLEGA